MEERRGGEIEEEGGREREREGGGEGGRPVKRERSVIVQLYHNDNNLLVTLSRK